jgi:hypothetical protein
MGKDRGRKGANLVPRGSLVPDDDHESVYISNYAVISSRKFEGQIEDLISRV